jgi:hypothetical protein
MKRVPVSSRQFHEDKILDAGLATPKEMRSNCLEEISAEAHRVLLSEKLPSKRCNDHLAKIIALCGTDEGDELEVLRRVSEELRWFPDDRKLTANAAESLRVMKQFSRMGIGAETELQRLRRQ